MRCSDTQHVAKINSLKTPTGKFFAIFSTTARNFDVEFCTFINYSNAHKKDCQEANCSAS